MINRSPRWYMYHVTYYILKLKFIMHTCKWDCFPIHTLSIMSSLQFEESNWIIRDPMLQIHIKSLVEKFNPCRWLDDRNLCHQGVCSHFWGVWSDGWAMARWVGFGHRYGNTRGDWVTGTTGTVMVFGTLRHTVYLYHSIMGILQVCYNRVSINFIVLNLVFSLI